jgi:hypothetical protein
MIWGGCRWVYVSFPGPSAREVEQLVATPLEKLLYQIDGVEYVASMARENQAIVTVRFYVGQDRERNRDAPRQHCSMPCWTVGNGGRCPASRGPDPLVERLPALAISSVRSRPAARTDSRPARTPARRR